MKTDFDITMAVACYNEEASIIPTLKTLVQALNKSGLVWEILVMDDASVDSSVKLVTEFINKNLGMSIKHHINTINKGLEWNVFEAASIGQGKYFWTVAGDNALPETVYLKMLSQVGKADMIIPYVITYEGRKLLRKFISRFYVFIVNFLSGYHIKYYNGSAIYQRTMVAEYAEKIRGFSYSAELIIALLDLGHTYVEIPVVFNDRKAGKSTAFKLKNFIAVGLFFFRLLLKKLRLGIYNNMKSTVLKPLK